MGTASPLSRIKNLLKTSRVNGWDGNDSQHPPRRPGRLLCLGRAATRPVVARQAGRRWWRGCACRFLRSQGLRGPRRHAGTAGARALSATHFCQGPFQGLPYFKDYQRLGDAAIKVVNDFTPLVERISIDEAFADVAGCTPLFGPPAEIAGAILR